MVVQRKGRATKWMRIQNELKKAHNMEEAFDLLDSSAFKLDSKEMNEIVHSWHREQMILKVHGKGVYATALEA